MSQELAEQNLQGPPDPKPPKPPPPSSRPLGSPIFLANLFFGYSCPTKILELGESNKWRTHALLSATLLFWKRGLEGLFLVQGWFLNLSTWVVTHGGKNLRMDEKVKLQLSGFLRFFLSRGNTRNIFQTSKFFLISLEFDKWGLSFKLVEKKKRSKKLKLGTMSLNFYKT